VSGTIGMGNLSLSALLARLKAFQLSRSTVYRASGFRCGDVFQKQQFCLDSEDISSALQYSSEWVSLVAILLPLKISQEQCVRKETKDNRGYETEHQGRSGSNFYQHAATSDAGNFQYCLGECVDKGRHLTDTIFRKWIL